MFKKINLSAIVFTFFSVIGIFAQTNNDFEKAVSSNLTKISLPANAQRVSPQSVPAEITQTFEKIVAAGEGKFQQGDSEVLVWTGNSYQAVGKQTTINRLTDTLKVAGWKYEVSGEENGITLFSLLKDGAKRQAIMGFYGESDGTLLLAWAEILPTNGNGQNQAQDNSPTERVDTKSVENAGGGSIVGIWSNGYMSMVGYTPQVGGTYKPGSSHIWKYTFNPNGTYEFIGYLESTVYNCTTSVFQDKRGRYTIKGNQITLTLTKNLWRKQNGCAPSSNMEKEGEHTPETYTLNVKRNQYGKEEVCLNSGEAETCYERKEK